MLTPEQFEEWLMKLDAMMERRKAQQEDTSSRALLERIARTVEDIARSVDRGNEARSREWETRYGSR